MEIRHVCPGCPRSDFTGLQLRALAKQTKDAAFARRLLALAEIFDGGSRSDAARIGGVGVQTIRDWVLRFKAKGPEGLKDGKAPGQPSLLKEAGWHVSKALPVPPNITLVSLPPKSPELNPVENNGQFMRDNWLSNRVFTTYTNIVDHCCYAWNKLVDQPWLIMSIGTRQWANRSCS